MDQLEDDSELALRSHIRTLLLDYALAHLTTDYVAFTEDAVAELLSGSLSLVSTVDSINLILQPSLSEALSAGLRLRDLKPYEEGWLLDPKVSHSLRTWLKITRSAPASAKCWDSDPDERFWQLQRPMSPTLTIRSQRETPKLGTRPIQAICPGPQNVLLKSLGICKLPVQRITESPKDDLTDALNIRFGTDPDTFNTASNLIKSIPGCSRTSRTHFPNHAEDFVLRTDSPPFDIVRLDSPPLFPRDCKPGSTLAGSSSADKGIPGIQNIRELAELTTILPGGTIELEEESPEMYKEHMVVISGWSAYVTPSSPTPSLASSSSEIDELSCSPSPPDANKSYVKLLDKVRMDDYEIPRLERIGGSQARPKALGEGESLGSFLIPILRPSQPTQQMYPLVVTPPKSRPSSPHTAITASMLGQPPSDDASPSERVRRYHSSGHGDDSDDIDTMLAKLQGGDDNGTQDDPVGFALQEKLDDKESFFMSIPQLPPPTDHPQFLSRTLADLVSGVLKRDTNTSHHISSGDPRGDFGFLKKTKGLKSLNIELSWRPFNFGYHVPTHEEVAKVDDSIPDMLCANLASDIPGAGERLSHLLFAALSDSTEDHTIYPPLRGWCEPDLIDFHTHPSYCSTSDDDFVLTEDERRRLHRYPTRRYNAVHDDTEEDSLTMQDTVDDHPAKKAKFDASEGVSGLVEAVAFHPTSPDRLRLWQRSEDSGIYLADAPPIAHQTPGDSKFCQIADAAEGFYGCGQDGELFPDVDPIHFVRDHSPAYCSSQGHVSIERNQPLARTAEEIASMPLPFDSTQQTLLEVADVAPSRWLEQQDVVSHVDPEHPLATSGNGQEAESCIQAIPLPSPRSASLNQPPVFQGRQSLRTFLELRAKGLISADEPLSTSTPTVIAFQVPKDANESPLSIPEEVVDRNTLELSAYPSDSRHRHRYMASMYIVEKRSLVRTLSCPHIAADLVEREDLGDAHLILDSDTAVFCTSLFSLPSQVDEILNIIGRISWRFLNVLIVFEAFPSSSYHKQDPAATAINPFSPPVVKAIRKFRRDLSLAEAYFTKCPETNIVYAFALTVEEVAKYVRIFGDLAEGRDTTSGAIWSDRWWLDLDEQEGERDLARVEGMNAFVASIILSQTSLEDFLQKTPEERLEEFSHLVGPVRMMDFNRTLAHRAEIMQLPSSSPLTATSGDSRSSYHLEAGGPTYFHRPDLDTDILVNGGVNVESER